MAKVMFYCPTRVRSGRWPSDKVVGAILSHFGSEKPMFQDEGSVAGFQTDLEWEELKEKHDLRAVVIFGANDACIYGVSLEAQNAGVPTYELVLYPDDQVILRDCNNLQMVGALDLPVAGLLSPSSPS
ncbi:MAG: hypothetical protein WAT81_02165 [Candidatus Moraniibacteriota bacterium]